LSENPYQTPLTEAVLQTAEIANPHPPNLGWVFGRWFLICSVSAAPSFVIAVGLLEGRGLPQIAGMICGILSFVFGYTRLECQPAVQRLLARDSALRLATKIGYGTRIGMSILFPIGIYLDLVVGIFAVGMSKWLGTVMALGAFEPSIHGDGDGGDGGFIGFFATTIIQGVLLNGILFGYLLLVYGIIRIVRSART
jgi:hypothetical protein